MSSKMLLLLLSDQVLCLYLISKPPKDGLFVMPSFIYYPLLLCFKLVTPYKYIFCNCSVALQLQVKIH